MNSCPFRPAWWPGRPCPAGTTAPDHPPRDVSERLEQVDGFRRPAESKLAICGEISRLQVFGTRSQHETERLESFLELRRLVEREAKIQSNDVHSRVRT